MTRNNALILATLYEVRGQDKGTASWAADRTALPQVAVAYQAGHKVTMQSIMQHKFMLVSNLTRWIYFQWQIMSDAICPASHPTKNNSVLLLLLWLLK